MNSGPVLHGVVGSGHSAAAVEITSAKPIVVTMAAQSRCIGSRCSAQAAVHVVGRPDSHGWASSQHAAVTACERAMNSGPVHDVPPPVLGGGGHGSQGPPQSTPVSWLFCSPSVHDGSSHLNRVGKNPPALHRYTVSSQCGQTESAQHSSLSSPAFAHSSGVMLQSGSSLGSAK